MLQAPIAELDITPGHVVEWRMRSAKTSDAVPVARPRGVASYNQVKHFTVAQDARGANDPLASYVAGTFEIEGRLDRQALESALLHFVRRHEVLRCEFRRFAGDLSCDALEPEDVSLELIDLGRVDSAAGLRAYLDESFRRVDTLSWPLFVLGAVIRDERTTVFIAFDHLVSDGMSTPIAMNDIATAYAALCRGDRAVLPEVGSYLDFSREQRHRFRSFGADDSRLDYWKAFMARNGDFFPRFPLDLGIEPGRMYPTVNETDALLAGDETEAMDARCRAADGKLFMGVLAAVGVALRKEGGPEVYRALMPVNERGRESYARALGWFVNTMPIEFSVADGQDFPQVMANVRTASAEMLRNTDVPFVKAWNLLAPQYAALRSWPFAVNFFSYLDFRKAPGAEHHTAWKARMHVWASHSNGICFWFHRNDSGLYVNSIFVDTPRARRTKADLARTLTRTMTNMARSGTF